MLLLNSWEEDWADRGFFRVENADVLGLKLIDVYWTEDDLKEEEITYFKKIFINIYYSRGHMHEANRVVD